jgi:hypothetical protein
MTDTHARTHTRTRTHTHARTHTHTGQRHAPEDKAGHGADGELPPNWIMRCTYHIILHNIILYIVSYDFISSYCVIHVGRLGRRSAPAKTDHILPCALTHAHTHTHAHTRTRTRTRTHVHVVETELYFLCASAPDDNNYWRAELRVSLYYIVSYYIILCYIILYVGIIHYITLHYITLHRIHLHHAST